MEHVWDVSHCRRCGATLMSVQLGSESARCGADPTPRLGTAITSAKAGETFLLDLESPAAAAERILREA